MSQHKALLKEKLPDNVIGEIAKYLESQCNIPGCLPILHLDDANAVVEIIVSYNKKIKLGEEK